MKKYPKFSIGKKMLIAYLPLSLLIIAISIFTLYRLNRVTSINKSIVDEDMIANQAADEMIDILFAQESYGQRYMILKGGDMLAFLFPGSDSSSPRAVSPALPQAL